MKLKNTTDYPDHLLRRLVSWCCRELGLPVRELRSATFRNRGAGSSGRCYVESGDIVVSVPMTPTWSIGEIDEHARQSLHTNGIHLDDPVYVETRNPNNYGCRRHYCERAAAAREMQLMELEWPEKRMRDLVRVTGHECAHRHLHLQGSRTRKSRRFGTTSTGGSEQQTKWFEHQIIDSFAANRATLIADWSREQRRTAKPKASRQEQNAAKAADALFRWQRKLKLAQTKVRQYRSKVRRYERIGVTAATKGTT